jgi:hypothetical protein
VQRISVQLRGCRSATTRKLVATVLKTPGGHGSTGGCGANGSEGIRADECDVGAVGLISDTIEVTA